jgi:hypothetical protein
MYVRERSGISRGGDAEPKDVRTREREAGEAASDGEVRERERQRGSMRRRQQVVDTPSLFTRAVGSVIKLVRLAEFEILFILFFVITFLLFKDLTARPAYNQLLYQKRFEEQDRLY